MFPDLRHSQSLSNPSRDQYANKDGRVASAGWGPIYAGSLLFLNLEQSRLEMTPTIDGNCKFVYNQDQTEPQLRRSSLERGNFHP